MFSLTDELIDGIISAMENQEKKFAVDAEKNQLVEVSSDFLQNFSVDEENFVYPNGDLQTVFLFVKNL